MPQHRSLANKSKKVATIPQKTTTQTPCRELRTLQQQKYNETERMSQKSEENQTRNHNRYHCCSNQACTPAWKTRDACSLQGDKI
jgi:hypothetical protein